MLRKNIVKYNLVTGVSMFKYNLVTRVSMLRTQYSQIQFSHQGVNVQNTT